MRAVVVFALGTILVAAQMTPFYHRADADRGGFSVFQPTASPSSYITFFNVKQRPTDPSPYVLRPTDDGGVWVLSQGADIATVSRLVPSSGSKTYFSVRPAESAVFPQDINIDKEGIVWFPDPPRNSLVRLDPARNKTAEIPLPTRSYPSYLTIDRQNGVWVTLTGTNQVAHYDPRTNTTKLFLVPTKKATPYGITTAADGTIWFAEPTAGKIARMDPMTESITEYSSPLKLIAPVQVAVGGDGMVWFTDHGTNEFGSFNPRTNEWVKYPAGYCSTCSFTLPNAISVDSHDKVWFSEHFAGRVARYDPDLGLLTEYIVPVPPGSASEALPYIWWAWPGPRNLVWFTAFGLGLTGFVNASAPVPLTIYSDREITAVRGSSATLISTVSFSEGSGSIDLGISVSTLEERLDYAQIKGVFSQSHIQADVMPTPVSATISVAANATLGTHYATVTASDGYVAVGIPVKVDVIENTPKLGQFPYVLALEIAVISALGLTAGALGITLQKRRTRPRNSSSAVAQERNAREGRSNAGYKTS